MSDKNFDDFLRQQLQASSDYIDDSGFTAQVMTGLPAPKRLNRWLELLIVAVPAVVISLLVMSQFTLLHLIQPVYAWVLTVDLGGLISLGVAVVAALVIVPALLILKPRSLF